MSDQPQTALDQFLAAGKRIEAILGTHGAVAAARAIPTNHLNAVQRVQITAGDTYYGRGAAPETIEMAKRVREQLTASFVAEGQAARDAKLVEIAAELQSIRAALPSLAARAAIELGHQSRMLEHEANGGTL